MKMDLNCTKIISGSRRKTFTVQGPDISSCNQTFLSKGTRNINTSIGDRGMNQTSIADVSFAHMQNSVLPEINSQAKNETSFKSKIFEDLLRPGFKEESGYLSIVSSNRNSVYEFISNHKSDPGDKLSELEGLLMEEKILKEQIKEHEKDLSISRNFKTVDLESTVSKTAELERKIQLHTKSLKEMRQKIRTMKEENINFTKMAKMLVDRINYPKLLLQKFLNVSNEGICTDEAFCQEISGGKCSCNTKEKKSDENVC